MDQNGAKWREIAHASAFAKMNYLLYPAFLARKTHALRQQQANSGATSLHLLTAKFTISPKTIALQTKKGRSFHAKCPRVHLLLVKMWRTRLPSLIIFSAAQSVAFLLSEAHDGVEVMVWPSFGVGMQRLHMLASDVTVSWISAAVCRDTRADLVETANEARVS